MARTANGRNSAARSLIGRFARKTMAGLVALSVGAMGLPALSTGAAQADGYYGYDDGGGYYDYGYDYAPPPWAYRKAHREHRRALRAERHRHYDHRHDDGDEAAAAIAGAVIGLAIGAIIASESSRYDRRSNRYRSYATPPQPRQHSTAPGPQVAHQWTVAPDPFTDEWYDYCADKYRSFDPETGTFQPYEGPRKLCR